jgi:hypothetical protein
MAVGAIAAIRRHHRTKGHTEPYTLPALCTRSAEKMREVLDRATKLVNSGLPPQATTPRPLPTA